MAVVVLLVVAAGSVQAQRRNRNHWTTDADIGRGEGPVDDQALRDAPTNPAEWLHYGGGDTVRSSVSRRPRSAT